MRIIGLSLVVAAVACATPSFYVCPDPGPAQQCFLDFGQTVNFYIGTAQLLGPGGVLISTTTALTVDLPPGPDLASQIAADPTVPAYVAQNVTSLIGNTDLATLAAGYVNPDTSYPGLGALFTALALTVNPVTDPSASADLFSRLTSSQPMPFFFVSDTGNYLLPTNAQYFLPGSSTGPIQALGPYDLNGIHYYFEGLADVNFYERDLVLSTSPEPGSASLCFLAIVFASMCCGAKSSTKKKGITS